MGEPTLEQVFGSHMAWSGKRRDAQEIQPGTNPETQNMLNNCYEDNSKRRV